MAEQQPPENVEETTEAAAPETVAEPEAAAADSVPAEQQAVLAPKERRQQARASRATKAGTQPTRTAEQRQADRVALRVRKAELRREGRAKARAKAKASPNVEPTPPREHVAGVQKVRQGVVVSDRANKTITVRIDTARRHRRYSKIVRTSQTLHAHDEANDANVGDTVSVREARPLSRTKRWRLIEVLERAK
jgi:small subunit ribosomal protein S17